MKFSFALFLVASLCSSYPRVLQAATPASAAPDPEPLVLEDRLAPDHPDMRKITSSDWAEPVPAAPAEQEGSEPKAFGVISPAARQPTGALSGRIIYMNGGHGWTYDPSFSPPWRLLRPVLNEMNEDHGNVDQEDFFAAYCFNAGAVVVPFRPLGQQTNEVVLDNADPAVTFAGAWSNSSSTIYYGAAGAVPYRYTSMASTETATATYTPTFAAAGYYPVYTWVRHGSDRCDQLYRVRHTGGESQVRIPHYMVGNGWVYLGEYYFNAGSNAALGSVVISNLRGSPAGSVIIADAIRFGNGMGSADNGGGGSKYPRECESARYWIKNSLGQGQLASLYDGSGTDEADSWSAPPKMSAEMNREQSGDIYDRIHISFHSNAGGGRGTMALITGDPTPTQSALAQTAGKEVNDDLVALGSPPLEVAWNNRTTVTYTGGYSEIDGSLFNYEMDATIIEVAFHDNVSDAKLLRDSKARAAVAKAAMHAVIKHLNAKDTNNPPPLAFLPEPPTNVRALAGSSGAITLAWTPPVSLGGSQNPTNYIIYRSTNGFGFGNPIFVGYVTTYTISSLAPDTDYYFRVSASNAGGESMPSEVVGCRAASVAGSTRALIVNGFDRFDRTTNLRQGTTAQSYSPPGATGTIERVWPRRVNSFDYVVQHGKSISAYGMAFDSCQNEAVINGQVPLANYRVVIWACGNESTAEEAFNSTEQARVAAFLAAGGSLFASGADIANDLDRASGPTTADRNFLHTQLHAAFSADNSTAYTAAAVAGGIFSGRSSAIIDNGSRGLYWVQSPDVLLPYGTGATAALNYSGGTGGAAAIQYDGSAGGGKVVLFGFPFETITLAVRRDQYMSDVLSFLKPGVATNIPPSIVTEPQSTQVVQGSNATLAVMAAGTPPLGYQWTFNGDVLSGATLSSLSRASAQPASSGNYWVVVSNAFGKATSQVATLQVTLPPALEGLFSDNFDSNTAGNWLVNRSSGDTRVTFNYDYSRDGIAAAPGSSGTTRGVKFEANMTAGVVAALSISPVGRVFGGDYRLHYSLWMNANGPFPAGGVGSTQHATAGLGTSGNRVQWTGTGSTADGVWFAVDGEGQATDTPTTSLTDFCAFNGTAIQAASSGVYAAGTGSDAGGNFNSYYAAAFPGGQSAPAVQQSAYPQQTGGLDVGTIGFRWRDVLISRQGNTIEWSIDGLEIATVNNATPNASNIFIGYWDSFASVSDNTNLSFGLVDNLRVERFITNVPPYITVQPSGWTVKAGSNVSFSVVAAGTAPLGYQWRKNGANLPGASGSSYGLSGVQLADAGTYSVLVTNVAGTVLSADATLEVIPALPLKFDLISSSGSEITLGLSGDPGAYSIERSTDLQQWLPWTNVTISSGPVQLTAPMGTDAQSFYRALPAN